MKYLEKAEQHLQRLTEERFYLIVIVILAAISAVQVTDFALAQHRNFLTIACDTAAFQNTIVNTLHGNWFRDTAYDGPNYLGLHSIFILLLIAPIYALAPSADTLFTLQILAIYSTAIPLYCVAMEFLKRPQLAFLCALVAMLNPIFYHMAQAPFHPESWILTAVLWSYFFYRRNHEKAFWIAFAIAITSGEQAAFIYAALGLSLWLCDDGLAWRRRYGKRMILAAAVWLVLMFGLVSPLARVPQQHNLVAYHYADWHVQSIPGLIPAIANEPLNALLMLFSPGRWFNVLQLTGLPLFLVFLFRRTSLLLLPFPVYFLMSDQEFYLYFHAYYYQFAFLAGYLALLLFLQRWPLNLRASLVILLATAFFNLALLLHVAAVYGSLAMDRDDRFSAEVLQAFDQIPPEAAIYCPHRYSAYLSNHPTMIMGDLSDPKRTFDQIVDDQYPTTLVHASQIDYIVCDLQVDQCGYRSAAGTGDGKSQDRSDHVNHLLDSKQWLIAWNHRNLIILRRATVPGPTIPTPPDP